MSDSEEMSQISKRRKMNFENETESSQTKLFNLNADCLREVFTYLNTKDLVNLMEANLNGCNDAMVNVETIVNNSSYETTIREHFLRIEGDYHFVTNDPTLSWFYTRVFRYFGSLISQISLCYYSKYYRHNAMVEHAVLKYSTEFLTKIDFNNADECAFEEISQPFVNVKIISFEGGYLSKTLGDLNRWFPGLESLKLNETLFADSKFIEVQLPNLKSLTLKNKHLCRCHKKNLYDYIDIDVHVLTNKNVHKFLELNPQLETFNIFNDNNERSETGMYLEHIHEYKIEINPVMLKFINTNVPHLRHLQLHLNELLRHNFGFHNDDEVNFKDLASLSVEITEIYYLCDLPIKSDQLVSLTICAGESYSTYCEILSDFVGRFKNIDYLRIEAPITDARDQNFVNMIKGLRNLRNLYIELKEDFFANNLIFCMSQFDQLNMLQIRCSNIHNQHHQTILNAVSKCSFMKEYKWRGELSDPCAHFIFKKS